MVAECGHCGRTQEVDAESEAIAWYAYHIIHNHPERAETDPVVHEWIRRICRHVAPTNGIPYRSSA